MAVLSMICISSNHVNMVRIGDRISEMVQDIHSALAQFGYHNCSVALIASRLRRCHNMDNILINSTAIADHVFTLNA